MMRRMRTVKEAIAALKESDEGFRMTEYGIRLLCHDKKIYTVTVGRRLFLDLDDLIKYLCG